MTELELEAAKVLTMADLGALVERSGVGTEPKVVAARLRDRGWLLPTGIPGVWEFAPAAHAGPIGHGDPYLPLRATLARRPGLNAAVCLTSALRAHGLADRAPERLEIAVPLGATVPAGLTRRARVVPFEANLSTQSFGGMPVHVPATILVHLAARPGDVRGWTTIADILADLVVTAEQADIDFELDGRPRSVRVRLAYLTQGVAPDLAERLVPAEAGGRTAPKIWFGPRGPLKRHNTRFSVADTVLPFDPSDLRPQP
ncbi:MAG: type IV toxin-antitoxin system AbiEi family antitoxin [Acidimicrobiales bacterium]